MVLSGKGGVGKSVVGAALALAARERGKRVLLVEVAAPREAARLLGGPPSGGRETEVLPGLLTVNLDLATVMDEYVRHVVRIEMLARRILESPIYHRFFAAPPGSRSCWSSARSWCSRRPGRASRTSPSSTSSWWTPPRPATASPS